MLLSRAFVELAGCASSMEHLGAYPVRGIGEPIEVFAFSGNEPAPKLRLAAG
ncbi:hypothetical protein D3C72_2440080 [compost metagenome]